MATISTRTPAHLRLEMPTEFSTILTSNCPLSNGIDSKQYMELKQNNSIDFKQYRQRKSKKSGKKKSHDFKQYDNGIVDEHVKFKQYNHHFDVEHPKLLPAAAATMRFIDEEEEEKLAGNVLICSEEGGELDGNNNWKLARLKVEIDEEERDKLDDLGFVEIAK